jgi:hypothetical protein
MLEKDGRVFTHPSRDLRSLKIEGLVLPKGFSNGKPTLFVGLEHDFIFFSRLEPHSVIQFQQCIFVSIRIGPHNAQIAIDK